MPLNFSQITRLMWIDHVIECEGEIARRDITQAFGISMPQASIDLRNYMALHPDRIGYDLSHKRYVVVEGTFPLFRPRHGAVVVELVNIVAGLHSFFDDDPAATAAALTTKGDA